MESDVRLREETTQEHHKLLSLIDEVLSLTDSLPERIDWSGSVWLPDQELLGYVNFQAKSLRVVRNLVLAGHYRESYSSIRVVFEFYFLLRLVTEGVLYKRKFKIRRLQSDRNLSQAKARFRADVSKLQESGARTDIIKELRAEEAKDIIVLLFCGIAVTDEEGKPTEHIVPIYHHYWIHYDSSHHLLRKKIRSTRWLNPAWGGLGVRGAQELAYANENKSIYQNYFTFDKVIEHLRLNKILNSKTATHAYVHYNYLSNYSHTTHQSLHGLNVNSYSPSIYSHYHSELCLLYTLYLLKMHLLLVISHFERQGIKINDKKNMVATFEAVDSSFGYFWFVFNGPNVYDKYVTANRKSNLKKRVVYRPEDISDQYTRYYDDPFERLKGLHSSQLEFTTGNSYDSPFHRRDSSF
jgi:hypothetical protein